MKQVTGLSQMKIQPGLHFLDTALLTLQEGTLHSCGSCWTPLFVLGNVKRWKNRHALE